MVQLIWTTTEGPTSVAKKRAFRSGYKNSTFPWADTAAASHERVEHCWISSEIAIIGAASPFELAYSKHSGATAFGSAGVTRPNFLLEHGHIARTSAGGASSWRPSTMTQAEQSGRWRCGALRPARSYPSDCPYSRRFSDSARACGGGLS